MFKSVSAFCTLLFISMTPYASADIAALNTGEIPQERIVLSALDDAKQLELFSHAWAANWKYSIPKEEVATRLSKDLSSLNTALKNYPDNIELLLLTGLVANYAYNLDITGSHEIAVTVLEHARMLAPADVRPVWFHATLLCQTNESMAGAEEFLSIEDSHPRDQFPAAFWDDYMECATVTGMPAHVLRAATHLEKLRGTNSAMQNFLAATARKRFEPFDPKRNYEPKDVWQGTGSTDDPTFVSTSCGVKLSAHGNWAINHLGLENKSCIAYFSTGPYKAISSDLHPSILLLVKQPEKDQTLQDFAKKYSSKGSFETYSPSRCPAVTCIALKGVQPGMYGKDGDGHGRIVVFERDQPEFSGLLFETPLGAPKPNGGESPQFYRPSQTKERIPGRLYYLVLLDTAASIEVPAMADFEFFLQRLTVE